MTDEEKLLHAVNRTNPSELPTSSKRITRIALLKNCLSISTNIASVVGIVLVNKLIFAGYKFPYGIALTTVHFGVTSFILVGLEAAGVFQRKGLPIKEVFLLSLSFCGFVVLTNWSLKLNSVAFYQMAKVLTTPFVAAIQYICFRTGMKPAVKLALGTTCLGVLAACAKEVSISPLGSLLALASVLVTAVYQVLVGSKQKDLDADSMQLLYYQAPISVVILLICCPFLEDVSAILSFPYTPGLLATILLSSLLAALVNVSTFLIIGHTSAITYNVVGHCKLCLVLLFGFLVFDHQSLTLLNLAGIFVALLGIISYSYIKLKT